MRAIFAATLPIGLALEAWAQQSGFQSGDGRTSIYLNKTAAILNFTETKFSFGYTRLASADNRFWGFQAFAQASTGITTLLEDKIEVPQGGGNFSFGDRHLLSRKPLEPQTKVADDWLLLDVGYGRSSPFVETPPGAATGSNRPFDQYHALAVYNALFRPMAADVLVGFAAGVERRNNLGDLTPATFQTTLVPAAAGSVNSIQQTQTGFAGNYLTYVAAPVYTDILAVLPQPVKRFGLNSQIGIDGFTRSDLAASHRSGDGGIGIFLVQDKKPTQVQGGISASWNGGKVRVAVVAGLNF
jgi:hypothetical protein